MNHMIGYIRVSDTKQEKGASLPEQRDALNRYAQQRGLEIFQWFEETMTAAKRGRPAFNQMLRALKAGKADGVIIHKIDRGARNLQDWANLGELIDAGVDVHFANESLDLHSRGGRLSADIQAVVAADYVRNLREETRKGFYGRLKQGFYPLPAPLGYLDRGGGQLKEIDPIRGPLVKLAFELYATGKYTLNELVSEMYERGMRNRRDGRVSKNGWSVILNNPFYIGLTRVRSTGEIFEGRHVPLIKKSLFDRVQAVLTGKTTIKQGRHRFLFRRFVKCKNCGYCLVGETQKGLVYYRCHTRRCPTTGFREEAIEKEALATLADLRFSKAELAYFRGRIVELREEWKDDSDQRLQALRLQLNQCSERINRLTDAYIDRILEQQLFEQRKASLLSDRLQLEEQLALLETKQRSVPDRLGEFLELAGSAWLSYQEGFPEEKRELLEITTSNRHAKGKEAVFMLSEPFVNVANRLNISNGCPYRDRPRTFDDSAPLSDSMKQAWDKLLSKLVKWFEDHPGPPPTSRGS